MNQSASYPPTTTPYPVGSLPASLRWLLGRAVSTLLDEPARRRGQDLRDVLTLDVVGEFGQPPTAYAWHIDGELSVHWHPAREVGSPSEVDEPAADGRAVERGHPTREPLAPSHGWVARPVPIGGLP